MTGLVFSRNVEGPGLHALIIGVSGYDHLRGGVPPPVTAFAPFQQKLHQLSGPARSAFDLAMLLIERQNNWGWPLKTCRVLVSPARDGSEGDVIFRNANGEPTSSGARFKDIEDALVEWRAAVSEEQEGAALFYFAGHGIQRSRKDAILLSADFLGGASLLNRTIDVNQIYNGMARSTLFPKMALNQFYFIDACQADFGILRDFPSAETPAVLDRQNFGADDRVAPVLFAASPGHETYALPGRGTLFGRDLLDCLQGAGATDVAGDADEPKWAVTIASLGRALEALRVQYNLQRGATIRTFEIDGFGQINTVLHHLSEAPKVPCTLRFHPDSSEKQAQVWIGVPPDTWEEPFSQLRNPFRFERPAGFYVLRARRTNPDKELKVRIIGLMPPLLDHTIRFSP